jgi:hypothetical protein
VNEQLEALENRMIGANEAVRVASEARGYSFEQRLQSELDMFALKFSQAAHNVESTVNALDRKLMSSVGALTTAVEGGDTHAALQASQLAAYVKRTLETGRQRSLSAEADLERIAGLIGDEQKALRGVIRESDAKLEQLTEASATPAAVIVKADDAFLNSAVAAALAEKVGVETVALRSKVEGLERQLLGQRAAVATVEASAAPEEEVPPPSQPRASAADPSSPPPTPKRGDLEEEEAPSSPAAGGSPPAPGSAGGRRRLARKTSKSTIAE